LAGLFEEILLNTSFDNKSRIQELLEKQLVDLESSIAHNALEYAISQSCAPLSVAASISEQWNGTYYLKQLRDLVRNYSSKQTWLQESLEELKESIVFNADMHAVICADAKTILQAKRESLWGLCELPQHHSHPWQNPEQNPPLKSNQGYIIPSNVSFSAASIATPAYTHADTVALCILSNLVSNTYLHHALRELGGAYGGGASTHPSSGTFTLYAYKDPNCFKTLRHFEKCFAKIEKGNFSLSELEEAKLSVLQDIDTPIPPGSKASTAYGWWRQSRTEEDRKTFRHRIFTTSKESVQALIPKYFPQNWTDNHFVTFSGKELLEKELALFAQARSTLTMQVL